jgi:hypothetical protein
MKKIGISIIVIVLANLLLSGVVFGQSPSTEIYVSPLINSSTTCGTMTFGVWVKNVANLTAFHLEVDFTPGNLEVISVVNGGFLGVPAENALFEPTNGFDNVNGKILYGIAQQGTNGDPTPRNGEGKLIEITLRAKKAGSLVPFTITGGDKSLLVSWPDAFLIPFTITQAGVVQTSSCPPTDIILAPSSINEKQASGTVVGTLTSIDPDLSDSWVYSLVNLVAYPDNNDFSISGDRVIAVASFDYGIRSSYQIMVRSTDAGGAYFDKVITITISKPSQYLLYLPIIYR